PDLGDLPLLVDQERRTRDAHVLATVVRLLAPHAPRLGDLAVLVGDEWEVEALLLAELGVALDAVATDADDAGAEFLVHLLAIAKVARFLRASRRHVLRVEVHHDGLSLELAEVERPLVRLALERGRLLSDFEHRVLRERTGSYPARRTKSSYSHTWC